VTVDELRAALAGVPGHLEVVVRASDDDTDASICCGVRHAGVDYTHNEHDTPFLAIDASTDVEPEPSCAACGFTRGGCERGEDCDFRDVPL
jgi:hypothetical protein